MAYLIIGWLLWCSLHSLLITGRVNEWIRKKGGFLQGTYRLFYSLFSLLSLLPLLWYQYSLPQETLFFLVRLVTDPSRYSPELRPAHALCWQARL